MLPVPANNKNNKKIINFLPSLLQTTILKSFFNATVEQVYQQPITEKIEGYAGRITDYFDKNQDFYIEEIDKKRQIRQFHHSITHSSDNNITDVLFYDDIVNYIKLNNGITRKEERLFEEEFYSWQPPIDIDAFLNYTNYYWCVSSPEAIEINDPTDFDSFIGTSSSITITIDGIPTTLSNGMVIVPKNDSNSSYNNKRFIVEGIGRAFILVEDANGESGWDISPWDSSPWDLSIDGFPETPDYITMERGCKDKNPWSLTNRWFHKDVIKNFNESNFIKIRAQRPIIIFERDLELWNFGKIFRGKVQLVVNCKEFYNIISGLTPGYDGHPFDSVDLDCDISDIGYDPVWENSSSGVSGVDVADGYGGRVPIYDGMRILIIDSANPSASGKIYTVTGIKDQSTIILQVDNTTSVDPSGFPTFEEYVLYIDTFGKSHYFWYNGEKWVEGQTKTSVNQEPLFQLYDVYKNKLDDYTIYNESNFNGNEIFSYSTDSTSRIDVVLGKKLKYNEFGEFVFENRLATQVYEYKNAITNKKAKILPYYFWKIDSPYDSLKEFGNNWNLVPYKSRQYIVFRQTLNESISSLEIKYNPVSPIIDNTRFFTESLIVKKNGIKLTYNVDYFLSGKTITFATSIEERDIIEIYLMTDEEVEEGEIYDLPLNLTNNSLNEEIEFIGLNDVFNHFTSIIKNQQGFAGEENGSNNYRDTSKEKWKGTIILQHTSPLSLLSGFIKHKENDFVSSILYCRNEYIRFYNKFINKLNSFYKNGTISSTNPSDWVEEILKTINIGKNERFPFHNTGVLNITDDNSNFIPPTPAFLGITPLFKPEIISDDKLSSSSFVLAHDGTYIPLYGDFRDDVILEFENLIYESSPDKFKNDYLPVFSWHDIVPGRWRTTSYSLDEINDILKKRFDIWLSENSIDFDELPTEEGFFGINYSSTEDIYGNSLPGHWRGIYRFYYDTDRPDIYPWEMLGFSRKPDWWESEYGPPPYTKGNIKLWEDLRNGYIRQGLREGIDQRFSRPELHNHIPVDEFGNLLDPVAIGIANIIPTGTERVKNFVFGDGGKIETVWRKSNSYSFDLALLLFLTHPSRFAYVHYDNINSEFIYEKEDGKTSKQFIFGNYRKRPTTKELIFHDEKENTITSLTNIDKEIKETFLFSNGFVRQYGYTQFVSSYIENLGKDISSSVGENIRSTNINLSYKASGFFENIKVSTDIFGIVPEENVHVLIYKSNPERKIEYSAIIVEKKEDGWVLKGYNPSDREFKYFNIINNNNYKKIGVGINDKDIRRWSSKTSYKKGDIVYNSELNSFFKATKDFVSGEFFNQANWIKINNIEPNYDVEVKIFRDYEKEVKTLSYGTKFRSLQEIANFFMGYQYYLQNEGIIFNEYSHDNDTNVNFEWSLREFLAWVLSDPETGDFISLSPLSKRIKINLGFGYVDDIKNNENGLLNRFGEIINFDNVLIQRNDDFIIIEPSFLDFEEENLIYFMNINVKTIEHCVVLDNETVFGNIINSLTGNIERFRISGTKSGNWKGRYEAPGYIIIGDKIFGNYEKLAEQIRFIYDFENINFVSPLWRRYSFHNISYDSRTYLNNLLINEVSQLYFYQGLIKQKGTFDIVDKLLRSQHITNINNVEFYEEWMFNIGKYGSYENHPEIDFYIKENNIKEEPSYIEFKNIELSSFASIDISDPVSATGKQYHYNSSSKTLFAFVTASSEWKSISFDKFISEINVSSKNYLVKYVTNDNSFVYYENIKNEIHIYKENLFDKKYFPFGKLLKFNYSRKLPTAGYPHESEIDDTVYNFEDLEEKIISNPSFIENGKEIRVADATDFNNINLKTWNVFQFNEFSDKPTILSAKINDENLSEMIIKTNFAINEGISKNDLIIVRSDEEEVFNGAYWVKEIENNLNIVLSAKSGFVASIDVSSYRNVNNLYFFVAKSVRFENIEEMKTKLLSNSYNNPFFTSVYPKIVFVDDARDEKEIIHSSKPYYGILNVSSVSLSSVNYSVIRKEELHADNSEVERLVLRGDNDNIKSIFEKYDPIRGIFPPTIMKNIDFISQSDPAFYTNGNESSRIDDKNEWSSKEVGKTWWNISKLRYYEYDMYSDEFRKNNWGKIFGGNIEIYEWIESDKSPENYSGEGEPYLGEETPYSFISYHSDTGELVEKYYFWVRGKTSKTDNRLPTTFLESIISNPVKNGIRWFAITSKNKILISGIKSIISENDLLQLRFSTSEYDMVHKDWILGREGDSSWLPPDQLWKKIIDSMVGYDEDFNEIPDPNLNEYEKYGISIRPRQTVFKNKKEARRNFIVYLNNWLEKVKFNEEFAGINLFDLEEEYPPHDFIVDSILDRDSLISLPSVVPGKKVLVENTSDLNNFWTLWELVDKSENVWELVDVQKYRVLDFVDYADFYDENINKDQPPSKIVKNISERDEFLSKGLIVENDIVLIKDNGVGVWEWQLYDGSDFITVAKQNATIKFLDSFYKKENVFAIKNIDEIISLPLDEIKNLIDERDGTRELIEISKIIKTIDNKLTNEIFFNMVKYAQSEKNNNNDWAVKTSHVVLGSILEDTNKEKIIKPNLFESFLEYFEEIKPYHVKIRQHSRKLNTETDNVNLSLVDFEYGTSSYSFDFTRKYNIDLVFDRISCTYNNIPEKIKFKSKKGKSEYKIPSEFPVETIPLILSYNPYEDKEYWNEDNILHIKTIVSTNVDFVKKENYSIEFSASNMILKFNKFIDEGTIEVTRRIHAGERISLYYEPEEKNILGEEYSETPLPKNINSLLGCDFKETITEGGAFEYDVRNFSTLEKGGLIFYFFDPLPSQGFFETHINPPLTPDGTDFDTFKLTYGSDWWNRYVELYQNSDEFLVNYGELYGFDAGTFDGLEEIPSSSSAANSFENLYDSIITGTSASSSDPFWPDISGVFDTILEGNKFIQPFIQENRPEELLPNKVFDTLVLKIDRKSTNTSNFVISQRYKRKISDGMEFGLENAPMNRDSLLVFVNGKLLEENTEYDFDFEKMKIRLINVSAYSTGEYDNIDIRIFRPGGNSDWIYESHQYVSQSTSGNYEFELFFENVENTSSYSVYSTLNGVEISATVLSSNKVFVSSVSAAPSAIVSFYVYEGNHQTIPNKIKIEYSSIPFSYLLPPEIFTSKPLIENVLVFNNGYLLEPPHIIYKTTETSSFSIKIDTTNGIDNLKIYKNNVLLSSSQYTFSAKTSSIDFDLFTELSSNSILKMIVYISGKYDYDINDTNYQLSLLSSTVTNGKLTVFGFKNNDSLGIRFSRYDFQEKHDSISFATENTNHDSILIFENEQEKMMETDYTIESEKAAWDVFPWDVFTWDFSTTKNYINYNNAKKDILVFYFTKKEKRPKEHYMLIKNTRDNFDRYLKLKNSDLFKLEENISSISSELVVSFNDKIHPSKRNFYHKTNRTFENIDNYITFGHEISSYDTVSSFSQLSGVFEGIKRGLFHTSNMIKETDNVNIFVGDGNIKEFIVSGISSVNPENIEIFKLSYEENFVSSAGSSFPYDKIYTSSYPYNYAASVSAITSSLIKFYFTTSSNKIKFFEAPEEQKGNLITTSATISANLPNIVVIIKKSNWNNNEYTETSGVIGYILRDKIEFDNF